MSDSTDIIKFTMKTKKKTFEKAEIFYDGDYKDRVSEKHNVEFAYEHDKIIKVIPIGTKYGDVPDTTLKFHLKDGWSCKINKKNATKSTSELYLKDGVSFELKKKKSKNWTIKFKPKQSKSDNIGDGNGDDTTNVEIGEPENSESECNCLPCKIGRFIIKKFCSNKH